MLTWAEIPDKTLFAHFYGESVTESHNQFFMLTQLQDFFEKEKLCKKSISKKESINLVHASYNPCFAQGTCYSLELKKTRLKSKKYIRFYNGSLRNANKEPK